MTSKPAEARDGLPRCPQPPATVERAGGAAGGQGGACLSKDEIKNQLYPTCTDCGITLISSTRRILNVSRVDCYVQGKAFCIPCSQKRCKHQWKAHPEFSRMMVCPNCDKVATVIQTLEGL